MNRLVNGNLFVIYILIENCGVFIGYICIQDQSDRNGREKDNGKRTHNKSEDTAKNKEKPRFTDSSENCFSRKDSLLFFHRFHNHSAVVHKING